MVLKLSRNGFRKSDGSGTDLRNASRTDSKLSLNRSWTVLTPQKNGRDRCLLQAITPPRALLRRSQSFLSFRLPLFVFFSHSLNYFFPFHPFFPIFFSPLPNFRLSLVCVICFSILLAIELKKEEFLPHKKTVQKHNHTEVLVLPTIRTKPKSQKDRQK